MNDRDIKVEKNLGLVHACAKKFKNRGIEYDDLFSAGCIGLIKAIDNFDESRGLQLSTYAVPVILGEMKQLFRDGGAIKVSRSLKQISLKANKICEEHMALYGCEITINALAEKLGEEPQKVVDALNSSRYPISLTSCYEDDENREIDVCVESTEEKLFETLSLSQVISELDDEDRNLINLRYYKHKTQVETAKNLGMTQVQVSRREKKILLKLREKLTV